MDRKSKGPSHDEWSYCAMERTVDLLAKRVDEMSSAIELVEEGVLILANNVAEVFNDQRSMTVQALTDLRRVVEADRAGAQNEIATLDGKSSEAFEVLAVLESCLSDVEDRLVRLEVWNGQRGRCRLN